MAGAFQHESVMLGECVEALDVHDGDVVCDCTLGGGGHAAALAHAVAPHGMLVGIDQDGAALEAARERLADTGLAEQPVLVAGNFADLDELLLEARVPGIDGVLFDLGVSSPQIDVPERGFSYMHDAPLDMRMDTSTQTLTAADIVNGYERAELVRVFRDYGEERDAAAIATRICRERERHRIETTGQLVECIRAARPAARRRGSGHPAKRCFQALRIEVNDELGALSRGLEAAIRWLNPGGRIAVISYHSLEDRIVKDAFRDGAEPCTCPPDLPVCACGKTPVLAIETRKPLTPGAREVERNPRAHSARLRVATRI